MGDVVQLSSKYRDVSPMPVTSRPVKGSDRPLYLPLPLETWTGEEKLSWLLGVIHLTSGMPVILRRHTVHRGLYQIQFAHLDPIGGLTNQRVWDVLRGFHEAVQLLKADA